MSPFNAALIAAYALSFVAIIFALLKRRGFGGTIGWVLISLLLPGVGGLAYLMLADPRVRRTRRLRRAAYKKRHPDAPAALRASGTNACPDPAHRTLLTLATRLSEMPPTTGNQLDLLTENAETFARIEAAIRSARRFVWAEYYIVGNDETGNAFLDLLTEKARDGIEVRLLYDAAGSSRIDARRLQQLRSAGGRTAAFLPMNPLRRRWSVHLRNHRKILIVDGTLGFTGGMNIGNAYSGRTFRFKRILPWRDTHLEIQGPAVRHLAEVFLDDWCFATDEHGAPNLPTPESVESGGVVSVIPSGPDQEFNASGLLFCSTVAMASSRCWLTSPYFVPNESMLEALITAALRGIDVRLLVPRLSDVLLMRSAIRSFYPKLISAGVRVFEYRPRVLHSKTLTVDGSWSIVGSANLDIRSFRLNFEVGALVFDTRFAATLEQLFQEDLTLSDEITSESVRQRSFIDRLTEGAAQLLSPLL